MNNELDELTRHKMNHSVKQVFNGEFWAWLIIILFIFGLGFITGIMSYDKIYHPNMSIELK